MKYCAGDVAAGGQRDGAQRQRNGGHTENDAGCL